METTTFYCIAAVLSTLLLLPFFLSRNNRRHLPFPPTIPGALPILGHLHLLIKARRQMQPLHRTLTALSATHGPILLLRFGSRQVLSISSSSAAENCLTTNDITFANRPPSLSGKYLSYDHSTVGTSSYGPHWKNLRRIAVVELLSSSHVNSFTSIRVEETRSLICSLFSDVVAINTVDWLRTEMKTKLKNLAFNTMMGVLNGQKYLGEGATVKGEMAARFGNMIEEVTRLSEVSSMEDFLPWMGWLGVSGTKKRMMSLWKEIDALLQEMVDERRQRWATKKTFIDRMLALQEQEQDKYSDKIIKGMIWVIISAGTDTTAGTMEWALSLLLNHPDKLQKARDEIDFHVGYDRLITDSDLPHLHYLQNIIKETLRLFPAAPLLLPHNSSMDCIVEGYKIASETMLLINVYAIHRDHKLWKDADSFKPERFDEGEGEGFHFLPFGFGRRRCPGELMANRVMGLTIGALLQCFEWKKVNDEDMVDLTEGEGLTLPKLIPLEAMYKPREVMLYVLSQL